MKNKDKYDLTKLKCKFDGDNTLYVYYDNNFIEALPCTKNRVCEVQAEWLESDDYIELTDEERAFLEGVINGSIVRNGDIDDFYIQKAYSYENRSFYIGYKDLRLPIMNRWFKSIKDYDRHYLKEFEV